MCIQEMGNGKYRLILSSGYKGDGARKRITKTVTAKSKREAEKIATTMQAELDGDKNDILTDATTFLQLAERYKKLGMAGFNRENKTAIQWADRLAFPTNIRKKETARYYHCSH